MRGHIRQRGQRSWAIVLDLGRDARGKRRQKWHKVAGTKRDAQRELTRLLRDLDTGTYVEPSQMTVGTYLEKWLRDYAKTNVSAKTFERYAEIARVHLIPALGHLPLARIQPLHIQDYYSVALESGRRDGHGGLSAQTVLHHHRLLRAALRQALKWQLLGRNPADAVEPPRPKRPEMRVLDAAETGRLVASTKGTRLFLPVLLAVTTGMRRGEILGLRWKDVDLKKATLAVRRSLEQTKGGIQFKEPKTQKGRRVVALPEIAVDALRSHKTRQAKHRLLLGRVYENGDLVCAKENGKPTVPADLSKSFARLLGRLEGDVPPIRLHDLRHTHATQLLREGIHPKVVSERLGHSTVAFTLDVYSHVLPSMQADAARSIDRALAHTGVANDTD